MLFHFSLIFYLIKKKRALDDGGDAFREVLGKLCLSKISAYCSKICNELLKGILLISEFLSFVMVQSMNCTVPMGEFKRDRAEISPDGAAVLRLCEEVPGRNKDPIQGGGVIGAVSAMGNMLRLTRSLKCR